MMDTRKLICGIILSICIYNNAFCFDEEFTHPQITEKAANSSNLGTYLISNFGFSDGLDTKFPSNSTDTVIKLLKKGSTDEDHPMCRAANHFHNPLKPWDYAGMTWDQESLLSKGVDGYCGLFYPEYTKKYSNVEWATSYTSPSIPGAGKVLTNNLMNWSDARYYYQKALTSSSKTDRDSYFAQTFQAVGQIMHLLEDMAVPAHVRNDFKSHLIYRGIVVNGVNPVNWVYNSFENYVKGKPSLVNNITNPPVAAAIRLTDFWDTNQYNTDSNPSITLYTAGLSEYTNANFASQYTLFTENYSTSNPFYFPHPAKSETEYYEEYMGRHTVGRGGLYDIYRKYYRKTAGEPIEHFAYAGRLHRYLSGMVEQTNTLGVDEGQVNSDYSKLLLPRAVGYSAGLLNYFFRGNIEITPPSIGVYAVIDGSSGPQQFSIIKAKLRNTTSNETIQAGTIQAVARYKKRTNYQPDLSTDPPTAASREADFTYSMSAPIPITSLSADTPTEFVFDFGNPIPAGVTDLFLTVVFRGTLGNEADNAVAVGGKDLNEPMHISIWNATDLFYLDGVLRTADEIRNDPALLARVDHNNDGIPDEKIDPFTITRKISFNESMPYTYSVTYNLLPAGRYGRLILLTEDSYFYMHIRTESTDHTGIGDLYAYIPGVVNQDSGWGFENTQVYNIRGVTQHQSIIYIKGYPDLSSITSVTWPAAANTTAYPATTINP